MKWLALVFSEIGRVSNGIRLKGRRKGKGGREGAKIVCRWCGFYTCAKSVGGRW